MCLQDAIEQSEKVSSSDALGTFWKLLSGLMQNKELTSADFDIQEKWTEKKAVKRDGEKYIVEHKFEKKTRVLYLDFDYAYQKYMEQHRKVFGNPGLGLQTMMDYTHNHWSYVGLKASHYFGGGSGKTTSAHMFDYDLLISRDVMPDIDSPAPPQNTEKEERELPKEEQKKMPF